MEQTHCSFPHDLQAPHPTVQCGHLPDVLCSRGTGSGGGSIGWSGEGNQCAVRLGAPSSLTLRMRGHQTAEVHPPCETIFENLYGVDTMKCETPVTHERHERPSLPGGIFNGSIY